MDNQAIKQAIMRRVYYSYALSFATHAMLWRGVILGAALMLLADWLHVASITENLLATPIGQAPQYVFSSVLKAAAGGELTTVLLLIFAAMVALSSLPRLVRVVPAMFRSVSV